VQFSTAPIGEAQFRPDPAGPARHLLHRIYYGQRRYRKQHGRWARTLEELGLKRLEHESLVGPPKMEVTESGFEVSAVVKLPAGAVQRWHICQNSRIWTE
jgi:hypothetical protein